MRRVLIALAVAACSIPVASAAQVAVTRAPVPHVSPYFTAEGHVAFALDLVNKTDHDVMAGTSCRVRLDSVEEPREATWVGQGGPSIPAGGSWRELIVLGAAKAYRSFPAPGFVARGEFAARRDSTLPVTSGRHTIAVSCNGDWSEPLTFDLAER